MTGRLAWCSLIGVAGVAGILVRSPQLTALLLFAPLLSLVPLRSRIGGEFPTRMGAVMRWTLVLSLFAFATVFLFGALVAGMPSIIQQMPFDIALLMMVEALSWCFVLGVAVFVLGTVGAALASARTGPTSRAGKQGDVAPGGDAPGIRSSTADISSGTRAPRHSLFGRMSGRWRG